MKDSYIFYTNKLEGEYKKTFDKIELYSFVGENTPGEDDRKEILMQVLDMMLQAQKEGDDVTKVVGNDLECFCKQTFTKSTATSAAYEFFSMIKRLMYVFLVFGAISMVFRIGEGGVLEEKDSSFLVGIIAAGLSYLFSELTIMLLRKKVFHSKKLSSNKVTCIFLITLGITVPLAVYLGGFIQIAVPVWSICAVGASYLAVYYSCCYIIKRVHKKEDKREKHKTQKVSYTSTIQDQVPAEIVRLYHKKNERRIRRGKLPITEEEFMVKFRKEAAPWKNTAFEVANYVIVIAFAIAMFAETFGSLLGGINMILLLDFIIELIFVALYYKFMMFLKKTFSVRMRLARRCIEEGKTLFELVKEDEGVSTNKVE